MKNLPRFSLARDLRFIGACAEISLCKGGQGYGRRISFVALRSTVNCRSFTVSVWRYSLVALSGGSKCDRVEVEVGTTPPWFRCEKYKRAGSLAVCSNIADESAKRSHLRD
jgi:hypothetical protein